MKDVGKGGYTSSVFEHSKINKHQIDYDGVKVLDTEYKLKIIDMLYIDKEHPKIKIQIQSLGMIKQATQAKILTKAIECSIRVYSEFRF